MSAVLHDCECQETAEKGRGEGGGMSSVPPEYWDCPMDKEEEEDMDIKLTAECADCEAELSITTVVSYGKITMLVRPCPHCVAQKARVASSSEWGRKKIEREAGL